MIMNKHLIKLEQCHLPNLLFQMQRELKEKALNKQQICQFI